MLIIWYKKDQFNVFHIVRDMDAEEAKPRYFWHKSANYYTEHVIWQTRVDMVHYSP